MAVQVNPITQSLPATTAIQDPAVRRFAQAVEDALRALDRLADALGIRFPDVGWKSGDPGDPCMVCSGMPAYMEILDQGLNDRLRDYLRGITVADVERWLAENKERKDGK